MQWSSLTLLTPSFTIIPTVIIITSVVFPPPFIFSQWVSQLELFHFFDACLWGSMCTDYTHWFSMIQYFYSCMPLLSTGSTTFKTKPSISFLSIPKGSGQNKIRYYFLKIWYLWLMFGLLQYDYLFKGFNLFIWPFSHPSWRHIKSGKLHLRRLEVPLPNS